MFFFFFFLIFVVFFRTEPKRVICIKDKKGSLRIWLFVHRKVLLSYFKREETYVTPCYRLLDKWKIFDVIPSNSDYM